MNGFVKNWLGASVISLLLPILLAPRFFSFLDRKLGTVLDYEMSLRWYLFFWMTLFLALYLCKIIFSGNIYHLTVFLGSLILYFLLALIFVLDRSHPLMEEFSYIRYTTTAFLFIAALSSFINYILHKKKTSDRKLHHFWLIISLGLVFFGLDESFTIHEMLGDHIEKSFKLGHYFTDLITLFYALLAVFFFVFVMLPVWKKYYSDSRNVIKKLFLAGIAVFLTAQLFDTFDFVLVKFLTKIGDYFGLRGKLFSDIWYVVYNPKVFANSIEEIFENFAAVLFACAAILLLAEYFFPKIKEIRWKYDYPVIKKMFAPLSWAFASLFLVLIIDSLFSASPLFDGRKAELVATAKNGLKHSDDLFWDEQNGLLLANENGPNVIQMKGGIANILPDPKRMLTNVDSVTSDGEKIFASDPNRGSVMVFRRSEKEKVFWDELVTRKDGLKAPEGIVNVGSSLFIVDEKRDGVYKFDKNTRKLEFFKPYKKEFISPEGIAYHPELKKLLITDDQSGYVFKMEFGEEPEIFLTKDAGLKNPEDIFVTKKGFIIISDNGLGRVMIYNKRGALVDIIKFKKVFSDVQGVAEDGDGNLYVVTADGFGSSSFMPSYLFRIENSIR